ncbi:helix-turn-helix transcriptional regulator [Stutzerimonas stutzeri]|nr:AlpA family phage regulatory protein [Stutzerimonas stutzeri]MCQ4255412.1 AlpA family phage regulatory protein [Stutzerimonas stutzeri]
MGISNEMRCDQAGGLSDGGSAMGMIRMRQLIQLIPVSKATIYDWMNPSSPRYDETFPRPVKLSVGARGGAVGWSNAAVMGWIAARMSSQKLYDLSK